VGAEGTLQLEGDPLTSERIKTAIERTLLDRGYAMDQTIVASGADGAVPHERGSGPIAVDEPVIVDIFPRSKTTNYHADMTRTFLKGEPDQRIRAFYETTREAKSAALDLVEPGVTGEAVHDAVCDVYEAAGYATLRADESTETGFIHSTGHGVGLDVHEDPSIGPGGEGLEPGHVITIEPGLYDPAVGGVRIEDLVVVTEDGHENLTEYPEQLVV
jgi:Xaa-Pro aminopeptidase